ncbi:MAG: TRAP transporter substrate-binding protein [Halovenus sp.]
MDNPGTSMEDVPTPERKRTELTRRTLLKTGAGVAGISFAGCSSLTGGDGTTELRLGHAVPPDVLHGAMANVFIDRVDELSGGDVQIEEFPNGELGTPVEMSESTSAGDLDMTAVPAGPIFDDARILNYPYLFDSHRQKAEVTDETQSDVMRDLIQRAKEEANVRILAHHSYDTRNINLLEPITSPSGMEGRTLRTPEQAIFREPIRALGASTTALPQSELPTALETGSVEGHDTGIIVFWAFGLEELHSHTMMTEHMIQGDELMINADTWDGLDSEEQDWLLEAARDAKSASVDRIEGELNQAVEEVGDAVEFIGADDGLEVDAFQSIIEDHLEEAFPELQDLRQQFANV